MLNTLASNSNTNINPDEPILPISAISDLLNLTQRTLRIYDQEKLLSPSRSEKNRRLYSINDVEKGKVIQYLTRKIGVNLNGIKFILSMLEQQKIKPCDYFKYVNRIAENMGLSAEVQYENSVKFSRRGRKPDVLTCAGV